MHLMHKPTTCPFGTRNPKTMNTLSTLLAGLALGFTVLIERLALARRMQHAT
jgi:hypothetical protein